MSEQERIELEAENDGYSNDFQRALAVSNSRRTPSQRAQGEALVAAGFAVVMERRPEFCGITDACLGESLTIAAHFKTALEAAAFIDRQADWADGSDSTFEVWPKLPPAPRPAAPDVDLPF